MIQLSGRPSEGSAVHQDRELRSRVGKRLGHVALLVALAVVPVLALNSLATADTGTDPRAGAAPRPCTSPRGCSSSETTGRMTASSFQSGLRFMRAREGCR